MIIPKYRVLNIEVHSLTCQQLLESLSHGVLFTINVDHYAKLQHDKDFYEVYKQADWVVRDSKILNLAACF